MKQGLRTVHRWMWVVLIFMMSIVIFLGVLAQQQYVKYEQHSEARS